MTRRLLCLALLAVGALCPAADLERVAGRYRISLRPPADGLYAREEMEIEIRIEDMSRVDPLLGPAAVVRARVDCIIEMPAMAGMPKVQELAHPESIPGEYGIHPTFAHGGDYIVRFAIAPPADQPFQIEFPLRVMDADAARKHKPRPARYQLAVSSVPKNPKAGEPADLELVIRDRERPGEILSKFDRMHEKLMHLVIVRSDLAQFAHEHPEIAPDGTFHGRYLFSAGGEYHLFAEVAPQNAGAQVLMAKLRVSGKAGEHFEPGKASAAMRSLTRRAGDVAIALRPPRTPLPAQTTSALEFSLSEVSTGAPVCDLEPYLGAQGHLILIHQDGVTFVHSHPDESAPEKPQNGTIPFLARLPKPGIYRAWLQFQRQGVVITQDFLLEAE